PVVGEQLGQVVELPPGEPYQRLEKEQAGGDLGEIERRGIAPCEMSQLMGEQTLGFPLVEMRQGARRQADLRVLEAEGDRHRQAMRAGEADGGIDSRLGAQ